MNSIPTPRNLELLGSISWRQRCAGWTVLTASIVCLCSPVPARAADAPALFARENLIAWCIVPFDALKRRPEERVAMLKKLGFQRYAYDWRAEHLPSFEPELQLLRENGIRLEAVWFPAQLDADAKKILGLLGKHHIKTQLWITMADPAPGTKVQADKIAAAVNILKPIAREAAQIGCSVGLYNHG